MAQYAQFEKAGFIGDCALRESVESLEMYNGVSFSIFAAIVYTEALRLFLKRTKMMNENNTINPYPVM